MRIVSGAYDINVPITNINYAGEASDGKLVFIMTLENNNIMHVFIDVKEENVKFSDIVDRDVVFNNDELKMINNHLEKALS